MSMLLNRAMMVFLLCTLICSQDVSLSIEINEISFLFIIKDKQLVNKHLLSACSVHSIAKSWGEFIQLLRLWT